MTSVVVRWAVVGAAAAALGVLPVSLAPVVGAEPQCADPAMCQSEPANPEDCNGGPDDMVCTRAGTRNCIPRPTLRTFPRCRKPSSRPGWFSVIPAWGTSPSSPGVTPQVVAFRS